MMCFVIGAVRTIFSHVVARAIVVGCFGCLPCAVLTAADSDPAALPGLDAVISEYVQAVSSLRTIDCTYRIDIKPLEPKPDDEKPMKAMDVRFVRDGLKVAMRVSGESGAEKKLIEGNKSIEMWVAFDGEKYSEWSESRAVDAANGYWPPRGVITAEAPTMMKAIHNMDTFLGKRMVIGPMDLESLLKRSEARITGWDKISGNLCLRVELGEHSRSAKDDSLRAHTVVWLDPKHSCLPRRMLSTFVGKTKRTLEIGVDTFESVADGGGSGVLWLPKTGFVINSTMTRSDFQFHSISINHPLSDYEFIPQFPQGAWVGETVAGRPNTRFLVGTKEFRRTLDERATLPLETKVISATEVAAARQLSARPQAASGIWWFISAGGIALLLVAAVIRHRIS